MSMEHNAHEWMRFARMDCEVANHAFHTMRPKPLEIICYHCQQAVEKALKAYLVAQYEEPPRTHDLNLLWGLCKNHDERFEAILQPCSGLNRYGIQPKYPHDLQLTEGDTALALRRAEAVLSFYDELNQEVPHATTHQ